MYNSHTSQVSATLTVFTKVTTFFSKLLSVASQVQTHITDQRWSRIHMSTLVNTFLQYSLPQSFRRNLAWNCTVFRLHFVSMLKVWRSVSKGCSLPICLSSPPAFLRETNCPTSPPVSPLTRPWWWASCLHSTLSYPSVMVLQEMIIFSCVCVHLWDSWGQWVPCWNVWTGGEWEWSWKTAVLEYPSCSFMPTHCETCINVALTHTHTHRELWLHIIMRTLKPFFQQSVKFHWPVFSRSDVLHKYEFVQLCFNSTSASPSCPSSKPDQPNAIQKYSWIKNVASLFILIVVKEWCTLTETHTGKCINCLCPT